MKYNSKAHRAKSIFSKVDSPASASDKLDLQMTWQPELVFKMNSKLTALSESSRLHCLGLQNSHFISEMAL
jgi:hypothetical protein